MIKTIINKIINTNQRKEVYEYLNFKSTSWFTPSFSVEEIIFNLNWLVIQLKLNRYTQKDINEIYPNEPIFKNHSMYPFLSEQQFGYFCAVIDNCKKNEIHKAYHELGDFIHDYRKSLDKPFTTQEKVALKIMIDRMNGLSTLTMKQ